MDNNEPAIIVKDLYKSFRLPHEQASGIKQAAVNLVKGAKRGGRGYETQRVLEDISFEIKKGEFFGIVGKNGSGKSTLLKLLAGIYVPDKGLVQVNGTLTPFIELGVGFNPELTGRENVYLNGALLGFSHEEMDKLYDDIVEFAELRRFMDQKLKNYSSGMQVRLAFSIAIRAKSDILLIDEVLAVGDAAFQAKCFDFFYELKKSDTTVVFISHDRGALERFCNRGVLIDNGQLVKAGKMSTVLDAYTEVVLGQMKPKEVRETEKLQKKKVVKLRNIQLTKDGSKVENASFGDKLTLKVDLDISEDIDNPIIGLTLWKGGVEDGAVYAANNLTEEKGEIGHVKAGSSMSYTVDLPRYINDGEYIVEVGIANDSATSFYLQNRDALRFRVFGSHNPHAMLANDANMQISINN